MRAVVQRVTAASVSVGGNLVSSIQKGLCVLVGISRDDTDKDIEYIVRKLLNLRLWSDDKGKRWMYSLAQQKYEILCVSQFTLYHVLKGNCPDFHNAMAATESKAFFEKFVVELQKAYDPNLVKVGAFGEYMQVKIEGDGPVTIQLESPLTSNAGNPKQNVSKKDKIPSGNASSGHDKGHPDGQIMNSSDGVIAEK